MKLLKRIYFHWILDGACIWLLPVFSSIGVIASAFLTYDFATLYAYAPNWEHQIDIIKFWTPACLLLSQAALLFLSIIQATRSNSIRKLETRLKNHEDKINFISNNIEMLVNGILLNISSKLSLARGESSRMTIYVHNGRGSFISFGRYSTDPTFSGRGRPLLPDNAGCISHAWANDWCYEPDLKYKDLRQKYGISSKEEYQTMRMKSKFYAVKRIDTSNGRTPVAVLVFESIAPNRFTERQVKSILDNEESYLAEIIGCLKDHIPDPQDAEKRGF